jgi:hypothetical protein
MPFSVPTFRYSSPGSVQGKPAMAPLRKAAKVNLGGLKSGLGAGMGAFFGKRQDNEWRQELRQRDEERGRTPGAQTRRIQELSIIDAQNAESNKHSHQARMIREREKHAGGFGMLGATDDRLSVSASSLAGDVTNNTPRFLETFPTKPQKASKQGLLLRASQDLLLLGSQPLDPVTKENRSINYNPILHKYIGKPRTQTDLQKRAKKERTGYVTIAGGRKDLSEDMRTCEALQTTMKGYVEYEHQKVDPVRHWLHDEQTAATGGLRTFPAQKGVSPLTRRLVQSHKQAKVADWHVNDQQRQQKLGELLQERVAVNDLQRFNHEKKMALQLSTFKIKDPYSDNMWGINHQREAVPFRGYNVAFQQHYHPEDEKANTASEQQKMEAKRERSAQLQKERVQESEYNIVHHQHKITGQPSGIVIPKPTKKLNKTYEERNVAKGKELHGVIRHEHSLDTNSNLYRTSGAIYGKHHQPQQRFGVASGTRNEEFNRYQPNQQVTHMESHANDESSDRDKKWEHHGHEDAADRYGSGRVHIHGGAHTNEESLQKDQWEKHAHEDAASRYGTGRVHVHGGAHTQEESAGKDIWNAGSGEQYEHMEKRKNGVNLIRHRQSITQEIGSEQHVTLAAQAKAHHRNSIAGDVTSRDGNIAVSAYAHHKEYGHDHNPTDESKPGEHRHEMANHGEESMRFDHAVHHHKSYGHADDETNEKNQYHASNLHGEENRFFQPAEMMQHHKAVGIDETTASHEIWNAMRSKGYEKVEQRTSAPKRKDHENILNTTVKAVTEPNRTFIQNSPRADHWKYDGAANVHGDLQRSYHPKPPPRRTNAHRGVARFI